MTLSLAMDILIVILLAATIFYAVRLTKHLDAFRSNRSDMERLIRDLSMQITRAQEGISTLDELAKESSDELRGLISKSTGLSDELQLITEAGDNLASRLESLATKNRVIADDMGHSAANMVYPGMKPVQPKPLVAERRSEEGQSLSSSAPSAASRLFAIRDPDFLPDDENENSSENSDSDDDDSGDETGVFQTKAERDLADALKRRRDNKG